MLIPFQILKKYFGGTTATDVVVRLKKANVAFGYKDFKLAKMFYEKSLELKPKDEESIQKLKLIEKFNKTSKKE